MNQKITAYYDDMLNLSTKRIHPLTCYYHIDPRPDKFQGTALTGVQAYMGNEIPGLTDSVVFTDFLRRTGTRSPAQGVLAYTRERPDCKLSDYSIIDVEYNFETPAFYTSLGANLSQSRLYLGVYGSMNVTDLNQGTVYAITP